MTNKEIAKNLREVAAAYTIKNENRFKIIAYEQAADTIENYPEHVANLALEKRLRTIAGVGEELSKHITDLVKTGKVTHFEIAKKNLPQAMFTLLNLPGFGARKAYKLSIALHLAGKDPLAELKEAAQKGKIRVLEGFGDKSEDDILASIESYYKKTAKLTRLNLHTAYHVASNIIDYLKKSPHVESAVPLGSLRRMKETVGDIDLAVAGKKNAQIIEYFISYPEKEKIIEKGDSGASIMLKNGTQVDMLIQPPQSFGSLIQHFTGSKAHNIKLREYALRKKLSLSEYGIKKGKTLKKFTSEEAFYKYLGLEWIPPELREDSGEIEASLKKKLPQLVAKDEIKGDLHLHSNYNLEPSHDLGHNSYEEFVHKADTLGYEYVGFSEHNPSVTKHSPEEIIKILNVRKSYIEKINYSTKCTRVKIYIMLEIDILADGSLPVPIQGFDYLDAAIVSIHSSFTQKEEQMTERILKGLSYPKVKIFGHPTGRLIPDRQSISANWSRIYKFCAHNNIALEINSSPYRLDLPDIYVREAKKYGCKFAINTDSHAVAEMEGMLFGIAVARRGWLTKDDIINTRSIKKFNTWIKGGDLL